MRRICIIFCMAIALIWQFWQDNILSASPPGRSNPLPVASKEAAEKLKHAEAALKQGQPELAYQLAYEVYQRYGNVRAAWFPSWVYRKVNSPLPDPNDRSAVIGAVVEGQYSLPLNLLRMGTFTVRVLFNASCALGNYEEIVKWGEALIQAGNESYTVLKTVESARLALAQGLKQYPYRKLSKAICRPLPLRYREEDYFILVPLDEACKVLGLGCSIKPNSKIAGGKGIHVTNPDAPDIVYRLFLGHPLAERLEKGKGQTEILAYAPFEEDGEVWVPFYWLVKQAGIRWWEVRDGKIYVAPKQGTK